MDLLDGLKDGTKFWNGWTDFFLEIKKNYFFGFFETKKDWKSFDFQSCWLFGFCWF